MVIVNYFKSPVDKGSQMSPLLVSIMFWDFCTKTKNTFQNPLFMGVTMPFRVYFVNDKGIRMSAPKIR